MAKKVLKVIVIDDEEAIRTMIKMTLESAGYNVSVASSGEEGISKITKEDFDIAITDIRMAGISGFEVVSNAKRLKPFMEIIVITGFGSIEDAVQAVKLGASDYMLKPFDVDTLLLTIDKTEQKRVLNTQLNLCRKSFQLNLASKAMASKMPLNEFSNLLLRLTCQSVEAEAGFILFLNEGNNELEMAAVYNVDKDVYSEALYKVSKALSGWIIKEKEPLLLINGLQNHALFSALDPRKEMKSSICVPLITKEKVLGLISVNRINNNDIFTEEDLEITVVFASDIALSIENAIIQSELVERNKQLFESNEKLQTLTKMRSEFISNVSHEFRTPLTSIKGAIDLFPAFFDNKASETEKRLIDIMTRNCILLEEMVEEILDFSRLEDNRFVINKEDFNITDLLNETSKDMLPLADKKNLKLIAKIPDKAINIFADRSRIRQVIVNLINNSIKYTDMGEIELGLMKDDKNVTVYVKDTGIGIADQDKKKIFERFYRVDNEHTRSTPGFGIGLTLCKFIIEDNHSGKIWFESEINKGSAFFFSIPLNNIVKKG